MPPMSDSNSPYSTEPPGHLKQPMIDVEVKELLEWAYTRKAVCFAAIDSVDASLTAADREECFQEALVAIGSLAVKTEPVAAGWGPELINTCRDRARELIKRKRPNTSFDEKHIANQEIRADDSTVRFVFRHQQKLQIRTAIRELIPELRAALTLKLSGASYEEIADVLDISTEDANERVSRARSIIRDRLTGRPDGY